jgi:single-strand DNA-binding protein
MNRVQLIGHLGVKPELRVTGTGRPVTNFTLATNYYFTDKNGVKQQKTEWHRIVAWDRTAEVCAEFLDKGRQVFIEGNLRTRQWEKDGTKHYTTEIYANQVNFLGGQPKAGEQKQQKKSNPETTTNNQEYPEDMGGQINDEDVPF